MRKNSMKLNPKRFRVGMRTLKTAVAVILSMVVVDFFGTSSSKLIFAMLGAMAAMQPTFKESLESCLTQIVGVLFGAVAGVALMALPISSLAAIAIGIVLVITLYNGFGIRFSPSLPCLIVVTICTTPDIQPFTYALGRIWDSAIGLGIGMLINTLIFPYDNSRQIHATVKSLDSELLRFLEELFDGDTVIPDADAMTKKIGEMARQLEVFSNQKLILHLRRQRQQVEQYKRCEGMAQELLARMVVLSRMGRPGRLSKDNRSRLKKAGAEIRDTRILDGAKERDVVTNYHVSQILTLRRELLTALGQAQEEG